VPQSAAVHSGARAKRRLWLPSSDDRRKSELVSDSMNLSSSLKDMGQQLYSDPSDHSAWTSIKPSSRISTYEYTVWCPKRDGRDKPGHDELRGFGGTTARSARVAPRAGSAPGGCARRVSGAAVADVDHGLVADVELGGDAAIGLALCQELQRLQFARREVRERVARADVCRPNLLLLKLLRFLASFCQNIT
jgi:hypothetical protein